MGPPSARKEFNETGEFLKKHHLPSQQAHPCFSPDISPINKNKTLNQVETQDHSFKESLPFERKNTLDEEQNRVLFDSVREGMAQSLITQMPL